MDGRDGELVLRENIPFFNIFISKHRIFLIFLIFFLIIIRSGFPQDLSTRSVRVKIAVDDEFRKKDSWRQEVKRLIYETSRIFKDNFGIEFELQSIESWYSPNSLFSMHTLLKDLRQKFSREDTDIILGLTAQYHLKNDLLGVASYLNGFVLLRRIDSSFVLRQTLIHEFSHLFGAIDLNEKKSVMGNGQIVETFDEFSRRIISVNKYRNFQPGSFPLSQQRFDEALSLYNQRKSLNLNETDLHVLLALIYLEKGDFDAVVEECVQAIQVETDLPEVLNLLGIAYRKSGKLDKAIDIYEEVNQIHPDITEVHFNLGIAYMMKGKIIQAELEFKKALKLNPNYAKAYSNLGHLYLNSGRVDEAIKETRKALKLRPDFPESLTVLGSALIQKNKLEKAEKVTQKALEISTTNAGALNNLGSIFMQRKLIDMAALEFRKAIEANPKFPEAHYNLGCVHLFKGNLDMAVLEFQKAIRLNPGYYKAYSNLASALLKKGQYEEALKASRKSVAIKPDYAFAYFNQGSAYLQMGNIKEAKKCCLLSISLDPLLPESFNLLGIVLMKEGDDKAGIQACLKALELNPDYLEAHLNLGHYYFSLNFLAEASLHYENTIRIDPGYSLAYNNLAVIFYFKENFNLSSQYVRMAEDLGFPVHPDFKKLLSSKLKR